MGDVLPFPERKPAKQPDTQILWPTGQDALNYISSYNRMKTALKKIASMPYDGEEYEDDYGYSQSRYLDNYDVRDYQADAVNIADTALRGKDA